MIEPSEIIRPSRRGFLGGLLALVAAPAIVRMSSLMPISVMPNEEVLQAIVPVASSGRNGLQTVNMITREAIRLWKNSNAFMQNVDMQYDDPFFLNAAVGNVLQIRLPNTYNPPAFRRF